MAKREVNMLSGSIFRGLLTITLPIMVMNVLQSLYNIIDMTMLKTGNADGMSAGAVGVSGSLISTITGLLIGISAGNTVVIARAIGRGDRERVQRSIGTSILFATLGGAFLSVVGIAMAPLFMRMLNCPEVLMAPAVLYFRLYFLGVPLLMVYNFGAGILRAAGDTRRTMVYSMTGGAIKVLLTLLFVVILGLDVLGVGLATIASWGYMCFMVLRAIAKNESTVALKTQHLRLYGSELREMLFIGVPTGAQQALYSVANVIIMAAVNTFGPLATTGISIANTFDGLIYQLVMAPTYAVMPYVSQNVGNKNMKRAMGAVGRGMLITLAVGGVFGSLSAIFSTQLGSLMSSDPEVLEFARQKMVLISSMYFLCAINETLGVSLKGMRRPIVPMVCTMIFMCAIRFPWVYFVFPHVPSLTFLYLIWPIGWVASGLTLCCFFFPTVRRLRREFAPLQGKNEPLPAKNASM